MPVRSWSVIVVLCTVAAMLAVPAPRAEALGATPPFGVQVTDGSFPSAVRIWWPSLSSAPEDRGCSGVLITPRHVLTAAHCAPDVEDSRYHVEHGGRADDVEEGRFSFFGTAESNRRWYPATEYWVHPNYRPSLGVIGNWDVMVLVTRDAITGVDPALVLGRRNADHLQRGAWVRHVGFGPIGRYTIGQVKSTLLTRTIGVDTNPPVVYTWGYAGGGDSGGPLYQQRVIAPNRSLDVVVGILTNEGIRSTWINHQVYQWIRDTVARLDASLLSNDYDRDGVTNLDDNCPFMRSSTTESDADRDGIGGRCDQCDKRNGGGFDVDGDGLYDTCDACPLRSQVLSYDQLSIVGLSNGYWSRSPVTFQVGNTSPDGTGGVRSDGRWFDEEFGTVIDLSKEGDLGGSTIGRAGLQPRLQLDDGKYTAQVSIRDGCGLTSAPRSIRFGVDTVRPTLYFLSPVQGAAVTRGADLRVEIGIGDKFSGIGGAKVQVPNVRYGIEPDVPRLLEVCRFGGPWTVGIANRSTCTYHVDLPVGTQTLYVTGWDQAGNEVTISREVTVR